MVFNENSINNMRAYSANPDNYVLRVQEQNGQVSIGLMNKGFKTWMKIHIGSRLGLFDIQCVKMKRIAEILSNPRVTNELTPEFSRALTEKQSHFERARFHLFRPFTRIVQGEDAVAVRTLIETNQKATRDVINHLTREDDVSNANTNRNPQGKIFIQLQLSPVSAIRLLGPTENTADRINSEAILNRILLGQGNGRDGLDLTGVGYDEVLVEITPLENGDFEAKISAK